MNYSDRTEVFFNDQISNWDLASNNYRQLENVRTRSVDFDGFEVLIQFNPGRITSTAAKVDSKSIETRPCFLCGKNRPAQQKGLVFKPGMTVLVNPFPIFKKHLTIVSEDHVNQRISGNFGTMLDLAAELTDYQVFYNGPQCGASAPDHFHFQAGNKGFLPVEKDFEGKRHCRLLSAKPGAEVWFWPGYSRTIFSLKGDNRDELIKAFNAFYNKFSEIQNDKPEPMLNILASYSSGYWVIHIFPRKVHRPAQFFAEGDSKILLSPASVDLGGVVITPREEDYRKIKREDLDDIFRQVSLDNSDLLPLIEDIL
ncbi:MAG TPA: DUF4922 domain-containing protein [Bacteroidales bacterium]|nr:DUF4922 domain-containing protein [Bacteroidales bacterium]HPT12486.1 DUF4922 domain-containing protein [Bacteroidales bacterium]